MSDNMHLQSIQELIEIMARLRSENGCQWDRQQTPESLKKHILEEAYELLEAIDEGNPAEICDELGDLLLQVVFQAQIFSESEHFDIQDVAKSISNKLKRRHPHIYADANYEGHEQRWEDIKHKERTEKGQSNRLAERIPKTLPALKRATKTAKKALACDAVESVTQLEVSLQELKESILGASTQHAKLEESLSQLLFILCKLSAATDCDPEELLRKKTTQLISEIDSTKDVY